MNDIQKQQIIRLREEGLGYTRIAQKLGLSENTVKSFCRRKGLTGMASGRAPVIAQEVHFCKNCGKEVKQNDGRKEKKFCSDYCRNRWWNSHLDQVNRKANYEYVCLCCKKPFTAYGNAKRKYCSHDCYITGRFGGGHDDKEAI